MQHMPRKLRAETESKSPDGSTETGQYQVLEHAEVISFLVFRSCCCLACKFSAGFTPLLLTHRLMKTQVYVNSAYVLRPKPKL